MALTVLSGTLPACMADMESPNLYADTLSIAAETVNGTRNLARRLGVTPEALAIWLCGGEATPLEHFLAALDIIGERPYLWRTDAAAPGTLDRSGS